MARPLLAPFTPSLRSDFCCQSIHRRTHYRGQLAGAKLRFTAVVYLCLLFWSMVHSHVALLPHSFALDSLILACLTAAGAR